MSDTERLPPPAQLPENDILIEIFGRITNLSDEINDPDGLLSRKLKGVEDTASRRHVQQMAALKRILDEVLIVKGRLFEAETDIDTIKARVHILDHANDVEQPGIQ